jgi:hypothetical protein
MTRSHEHYLVRPKTLSSVTMVTIIIHLYITDTGHKHYPINTT